MLNEILASAVLKHDTQALRFERFCNDIVGQCEGGIQVLPTSSSWDRGRDGRANTTSVTVYVCSSLNDRVDQKSISDFERLASFAQEPYRAYFCSNQALSEKRCDEIRATLSALLPPSCAVTVLGQTQLGHLCEKFPDVFRRYYEHELTDLTLLLQGPVQQRGSDDASLRLALLSLVHDTSDAIRDSLYANSLRAVLNGKRLNLSECARDLSSMFHLSRMLPPDLLGSHLEQLGLQGDVKRVGTEYELTGKGVQTLQLQEHMAATSLLVGQEAVRTSLESELGYSLAEDHFGRIWSLICQKISLAFYERGQQLVAQLSILVGQGRASREGARPDTPLFFLDDLAETVAATSSLPAQQEELRTAVCDLFAQAEGPAFEWLSRLCASFVALCALGLEAQSGKAVARLFSKMTLVLDTDIALSLLCEGEPNHLQVSEVVGKWRAIGARIVVGHEVLFEIAHHAAIAGRDYEQVRNLLPGTRTQRLRLIENAFVRAFAELLASQKIRLHDWARFIAQFVKDGREDVGTIAEILVQEYQIGALRPATTAERDVERRARALLERSIPVEFGGERLRIARDKAGRDATLYAAIVRECRALREEDVERACLLVSSARRLADVEEHVRGVGEPQIVMPLGALAYLMSLVPGVSLGVGALQSLLFDIHKRFSGDLERLLLRIVSESHAVGLPWAKRHTLMREVRKRLLTDAQGVSTANLPGRAGTHELEREALEDSELERTAAALRDSLRAVAADRPGEQRIIELEKVVASLRRENEALRSQAGGGREPPSPRPKHHPPQRRQRHRQ